MRADIMSAKICFFVCVCVCVCVYRQRARKNLVKSLCFKKTLKLLRLLKFSSLAGRLFQGPITLCAKKYFHTSCCPQQLGFKSLLHSKAVREQVYGVYTVYMPEIIEFSMHFIVARTNRGPS